MSPMKDVRAIAFYLPQYHPIPENDEWWGAGFTEWRNVTNARPRFSWHYQPHLPANLGFYDLRLPEVREAQATLARRYGLHAFCYYHYWFRGRRVLQRPFEEVLLSGEPTFPFCLCWANENWTRAWDGSTREVLLEQSYGEQDSRAHMRSLIPALSDSRYIRVDGRPLLLVYRASLIPEVKRFTDVWRDEAERGGVKNLMLARVESLEGERGDPRPLGFDLAIEFAPDWERMGKQMLHGRVWGLARRLGVPGVKQYRSNSVYRYDDIVQNMLAKPTVDYPRVPCVAPSWDNTARRKLGATILRDATPEMYEAWLRENVRRAPALCAPFEPLVFINAWNEWAEGAHLEPDLKYGTSYLEATARALRSQPSFVASSDGVVGTTEDLGKA